MKYRQLVIIIALAACMPLAVCGAQFAGASLPLVPAAIVAAGLCGGTAYHFFKAVWNAVR